MEKTMNPNKTHLKSLVVLIRNRDFMSRFHQPGVRPLHRSSCASILYIRHTCMSHILYNIHDSVHKINAMHVHVPVHIMTTSQTPISRYRSTREHTDITNSKWHWTYVEYVQHMDSRKRFTLYFLIITYLAKFRHDTY